MKVPEYIVKTFGESLEEIKKAKTSQPQKREASFIPTSVTMTVDECKSVCKDIGVEYKEGYESRVLRYTCSDESVDRMGDVIKQDGWNLENYQKNPVIMGFHDYGTFPIGNSLKTWIEDGKLKMHVLFADKEVNEDADKAFRMAKSGFMKAGSVGFAPIKYHFPSKEEKEELGIDKDTNWGVIFDQQELLEFSACGVPANANAIQESINKGVMEKKDFKGWVNEGIFKDLLEKQAGSGETSTSDGHSHPYSVNEEGMGSASEGETGHKHAIKDFTVAEVEEHSHTLPNKSISSSESLPTIGVSTEEAGKYIDQILREYFDKRKEEKAGAVLSKKNKASISNAIDGMRTAIDALEKLLKDATSEPEDLKPDEDKDVDSPTIIDIDLDTLESDDGDGLYNETTITIDI